MSDKVPTEEEIRIASNLFKRYKDTAGDPHASDEEVNAAVKVFGHMSHLGVLFRQEMLTAWATSQWSSWSTVQSFRNIK